MIDWVKTPVVIWCDDLGGAGSITKPSEDCGWAMFTLDNGISKLERIMIEHPQVVITLFIVPNWSQEHKLFKKKVKWENVQKINDNSRGFRDWLRDLDNKNWYDFQLHGYQHKTEIYKPFYSFKKRAKQEYELLNKYEDVLNSSQEAVRIFTSTFGRKPSGNRFPGWKPGKYGYEVMKKIGIKWFADNKSTDEINFNYGLVNFPIGYKLNQITFDEVDKQLSNEKGLFITTHIEGATPTNPYLKNSIYYYNEKLTNIINYIEDKYDVWWVGGEVLSKYIYQMMKK